MYAPYACPVQALRDLPAYTSCRKDVDDFLEVLPLVQALTHTAIRPRCEAGGRHPLAIRLSFLRPCILHRLLHQALPALSGAPALLLHQALAGGGAAHRAGAGHLQGQLQARPAAPAPDAGTQVPFFLDAPLGKWGCSWALSLRACIAGRTQLGLGASMAWNPRRAPDRRLPLRTAGTRSRSCAALP